MTPNTLLQFFLFLVLLMVLAKPLGEYMGRVFEREPTFLDPVLRPLERSLYRAAGIQADDRMDWKGYAWSLILFSLVGFGLLVLLQRTQHLLPFNPQHLGPVPWPIGVRPNSPPQRMSVSSSRPRCLRSLIRAAVAWSTSSAPCFMPSTSWP